MEIRVGDSIRFVGPEYRWASGPSIGEIGMVTERKGYTCRGPNADDASEELVTVMFHGHDRPSVISLSRVELIGE